MFLLRVKLTERATVRARSLDRGKARNKKNRLKEANSIRAPIVPAIQKDKIFLNPFMFI
jgi:hypothetical protein